MEVGAGAVHALVAADERQRRDIWHSRRLLSEAMRRLKPHKVSEDIVVPRSRLPEMVARIGALGEQHGLMTASYGHAGDGNLHAQVLYDSEDELPKVRALLEDLFKLTLALGGTITGEHGVGLEKKGYMSLIFSPDDLAAMEKIRTAFGPTDHFNPCKIFPTGKGCAEGWRLPRLPDLGPGAWV